MGLRDLTPAGGLAPDPLADGNVAVDLLGGGYDWSGSPVDVKALADRVAGARFTEMRDVGHFPMSENPAVFRRYLMPILDEIRSARPRSASSECAWTAPT